MAGNKTSDGIPIVNILRILYSISGVTVREAANHPYLAIYNGQRPCPVATSTNARTMIVPWLKQITGNNSADIYSSLKTGKVY